MNIDLSGRTAIVAGSIAGIGRATAKGLAWAGATVIINGPHPGTGCPTGKCSLYRFVGLLNPLS